VQQCAMLHKYNPSVRCFVYRNLVKALPWYSSVREKINDAAFSGWFLHNKPGGSLPNGSYHVPQCDDNWDPPRCTELYHDVDQTPGFPRGDGNCPGPCDCGGVPCGEYLWDHRNASLREWILNEFLLGPTGLGSPEVQGLYLDDNFHNTSQPVDPSWMPPEGYCDHSAIGGPSEVNFFCTVDMGLTQEDTTAITDGWKETMALVEQVVLGAGGWAWAFFKQLSIPDTPASCQAALRQACTEGTSWDLYDAGVMVQWTLNKGPYNATFQRTSPLPHQQLDIAYFLTVRGPWWWLGYGWVGCSVPYDFPDALKMDYGVPLGTCKETLPAVFTRQWSKATATVDCNTLSGEVVELLGV